MDEESDVRYPEREMLPGGPKAMIARRLHATGQADG